MQTSMAHRSRQCSVCAATNCALTPAVSQLVVAKSIPMARDLLHTPVIGLVENMTAYVCPTCGDVHPLFGRPAADDLPLGVPLLGRIPFDPRMAEAGDRGTPYVLEHG